jgi:hypothetical protein
MKALEHTHDQGPVCMHAYLHVCLLQVAASREARHAAAAELDNLKARALADQANLER